jgi:hypothetical protein
MSIFEIFNDKHDILIFLLYVKVNPFSANLNASSKSLYEVCSLSSEYSFCRS